MDGVRYFEDRGVYPVEEDTLIFIRFVREELERDRGTLLDMGCGSGLITLFANRIGWNVISVDREPRSLILVRKNLSLNRCTSRPLVSDLFDGIPRGYMNEFDLATFNPPYLGYTGDPISLRDGLALFGGDGGWEILGRFINGSDRFMKSGGILMFLAMADWDITDLFDVKKFSLIDKRGVDIQGERFEIVKLERI